MFEEPNFCLVRDSNAFAYNLHFWDDGHGVDLALLFGFRGMAGREGKRPDGCLPSQEDCRRSSQFQNMIVSFARSGKPIVDGLEWKRQSEIMNLMASPEAQPFKEEIVAFQDLKRQIVADLKIDTILPQNTAA